jgi:hypothetical protein
VLAVYSRDDQIVPPAACQVASDIGTNVEAAGTYGGLVDNRAIHPTLARFLAANR